MRRKGQTKRAERDVVSGGGGRGQYLAFLFFTITLYFRSSGEGNCLGGIESPSRYCPGDIMNVRMGVMG